MDSEFISSNYDLKNYITIIWKMFTNQNFQYRGQLQQN